MCSGMGITLFILTALQRGSQRGLHVPGRALADLEQRLPLSVQCLAVHLLVLHPDLSNQGS